MVGFERMAWVSYSGLQPQETRWAGLLDTTLSAKRQSIACSPSDAGVTAGPTWDGPSSQKILLYAFSGIFCWFFVRPKLLVG